MTAADYPEVRGLRDYWAHATLQPGAAKPPFIAVRLLLDTVGVGIEQAATFLGAGTSFESFQAWLAATAGHPDPLLLARYHAWRDGTQPPAAIRRRDAALAAAPPVLGPADLAAFERDGYVVLRQAVAADEARAVESLLWEAVEATEDDPDSWYRRGRRRGIMVPLYQHPALEAARRAPRIHKAFAQLWKREDLWMTVDRLSFNPPERPGHCFPGPHLHWDVSLAPPIPFATQAILYLTDTEADQGALQLVPGFHRRIHGWLHGLGDADPRRVDLGGEAVAVAAGAGDLVIWRWELPHGASANRGSRPRMAQYLNMYPADLATNPAWR